MCHNMETKENNFISKNWNIFQAIEWKMNILLVFTQNALI